MIGNTSRSDLSGWQNGFSGDRMQFHHRPLSGAEIRSLFQDFVRNSNLA